MNTPEAPDEKSKSRIDWSKFGFLFHVTLAGVASLFLSAILYSVVQGGVEALLTGAGNLGVLIFEDAAAALQIMVFGLVFLPSGMAGGIYIGYKVKDNPRVIYALPGITGFVLFSVLSLFSGGINLYNLDIVKSILVPFSGNIIGSYMGGYTMNWPPKKTSLGNQELGTMAKPALSESN